MNHRPFIILKQALSLDGYLDNVSPFTFSNQEDKKRVHILRSLVDSILVGANTIKNDNPSLLINCDLIGGSKIKQPRRIIIEGKSRLDDSLYTLSDSKAETIVFRQERNSIFESPKYTQILYKEERLTIRNLLHVLYQRGVRSVLVEGGAMVINQFINERFVDAHRLVFAPVLIGNKLASKIACDSGLYAHLTPKIQTIDDVFEVWFTPTQKGEDFYLHYRNSIQTLRS